MITFNPSKLATSDFNGGVQGWSSNDKYPRYLADVNKDGRQDIVGFGYYGVYVAFGQSNGTFSGTQQVNSDFGISSGWASNTQNPRLVGDVNGDGFADIVGFNQNGVYVAVNNKNNTFATKKLVTTDLNGGVQGWVSNDSYPRYLADVNKDGRQDIVAFGYSGVYLALGQSDGTFSGVQQVNNDFGVSSGWVSNTQNPRLVGDVNGDGFADIVGFSQNGVYVALNNKNNTFAAKKLVSSDFSAGSSSWSSNDKYPRYLADINKDGRQDIVGFGSSGVYIAFGQSDGSFTTVEQAVTSDFNVNSGWVSNTQNPRLVGDVNGDGYVDLVGFNQNGVYVASRNVPVADTTLAFGSASYSVSENGTPVNAVTITRAGNSNNAVTCVLQQSNGTAQAPQDYSNSAIIVSFGSGETSKTVSIPIVNDSLYEGNETVNLTLSNPTGGAILGSQKTSVLTIVDDDPPSNLIVGGYVGDWNFASWSPQSNFDQLKAEASKLTHLFYSFADVDPQGNVNFQSSDYANQPTFLKSLKTINPNLKIIVSIGGWGENDFAKAAATDVSRANFTTSAVNFMKNNGFDGIDIDWEFPRNSTENANCVKLFQTLKQQLNLTSTIDNKKYSLSMAATGSPGYEASQGGLQSSDWKNISSNIDFLNVMGYEYHGEWDPVTGHQAPLYGVSGDQFNLDSAVKYYQAAGFAPKTLVAGIPLYSHKWTGVTPGPNGNGLGQPGKDVSVVDYKALRLDSSYQSFFDPVAKVSSLYSSRDQIFYTYEDSQSIGAKTSYVKSKGLGGAFFWEVTQDYSDQGKSLINLTSSQLPH